jgi:hypothetical protein
MRRFLLAASVAACVAMPVWADSIARNGDDWIRLTAQPCAHAEVTKHLASAGESPKDYRAASARVGGQEYAACWKPMYAQEVVFLRYSDGDAGLIQFNEFKPADSI